MAERDAAPPSDFDHRWLDRLKANHRIVFDCHTLGAGVPLQRAANYFDACRDGYGAAPSDIQAVLTLHAAPAPIAFTDAAWTKYGLGPRDAKTGQPGTRNIFASEDPADPYATVAVPVLQRRGAIFCFCNNVLKQLVTRYARSRNETPEVVRADLIASFLPGVVLVPAAVAATVVAQEHGCRYMVIR